MKNKNWTFNVSNGGQVIFAQDKATVYAIQNNGVSTGELDSIIKGIMENLSYLEKEDAESIKVVVDMAKNELVNEEPKVSRLRSCVTLLEPMLTIANGIPTLANNLQGLIDYITPYIH